MGGQGVTCYMVAGVVTCFPISITFLEYFYTHSLKSIPIGRADPCVSKAVNLTLKCKIMYKF